MELVDIWDFDGGYKTVDPQVYQNCKVYGPYKRNDGRMHCVIVFPNNSRKTVSYPKYLMELKLNRYLSDNETVDHDDGDFNNNSYDNLKVLDRSEHCRLDAKRVKEQWFKCDVCGTEFSLSGRRLQYAYNNHIYKNATGPYCSKPCAGIASHATGIYVTHEIVKELVTLKSLMRETS